jgi:hypothetical protein
MSYYLIENMMGFEKPISEGGCEVLKLDKERHEKNPTTKKVGSGKNQFLLKARYYLLPKDAWDAQHCPLIPVDFS